MSERDRVIIAVGLLVLAAVAALAGMLLLVRGAGKTQIGKRREGQMMTLWGALELGCGFLLLRAAAGVLG